MQKQEPNKSCEIVYVGRVKFAIYRAPPKHLTGEFEEAYETDCSLDRQQIDRGIERSSYKIHAHSTLLSSFVLLQRRHMPSLVRQN